MNYLSLGGIILDDIVFPDGRTMMGILGGGGLYAAVGMRLWSDAVGLVARVGTDFDLGLLDSLHLDDRAIQVTEYPTPRAWQLYEEDGTRTQIPRVSAEAWQEQLEPRRRNLPPIDGLKGAHMSTRGDTVEPETAKTLHTAGVTVSMEPIVEPGVTDEEHEIIFVCLAYAEVFSPGLQDARLLLKSIPMSIQRDIDVLAIGGIDADLVLTVPRLPSHDEKVLGTSQGWLAGGPAANLACAASRLGLRVNSFSNVGDDERGRIVIEGFEACGVDTSLIQVHKGREIHFTVILIDPTGEKAIVVVPAFRDEFPLDVAAEVFPKTSFMVMMPQDQEQFLALAALAQEHGTQVLIDVETTVGADRDTLAHILTRTDVASFNKDGFEAATGAPPSVDSARELLAYGPHTVVVTRGAAGSLAVTRDEEAEHAGYAVTAVDTTGAGDTFNAAFIAATLRKVPLAERLRFANAAAALSVTAMGPRGRLPTWDEVETFLEEARVNTA